MENKLNEAGALPHNQGPESKGPIHDDFNHSSVMEEQQIVPYQKQKPRAFSGDSWLPFYQRAIFNDEIWTRTKSDDLARVLEYHTRS
jgi:hypothetical protein